MLTGSAVGAGAAPVPGGAADGGGSGGGGRILALWCPDWPVAAAAREAGVSPAAPAAVFRANRVQVCTAAARDEGIRTGMRRREAQSRCPDLAVLAVDPGRDARLFEPVAAAVESLVPGIEVLRAGLLACRIRGPARYFGSEQAAAERIVDVVESLDVECHIGIAGSLPVAVLAARRTAMVPPGGDGAFCAGLPIAELARDPAIAPPERRQLVDLLVRLGITTAGAFAALPADKVAARFGPDGIAMHRLAAGSAERDLSRRRIDADLSVAQSCDPPLDRVDTAAFAARALAQRFHAGLAAAGLACTRLSITATTERGESLRRIWRCGRPLTPAATADRLRWQLDGWLTRRAGGADAQGPGAIVRLCLEPVEAIGAGLVQYGLWGPDGQEEHRAGWALARVQGLLGPQAVLTPVLSGGRGPSDRVTVVPWGEQRIPQRDPSAPWPGAIPAPAPAHAEPVRGAASGRDGVPAPGRQVPGAAAGRETGAPVAPGAAVAVSGPDGRPVVVTGRGLLTADPASVDGHRVLAWAGPWLLDERWWVRDGPVPPACRRARMQVVTGGGPPVLLGFGSAGWQLEAVYD